MVLLGVPICSITLSGSNMIVSLEIVLILLVNLYSQNECAKNNETTSNMYYSNTYTTTMITGNNTSSSNTTTSTESFLDNNTVTIPDTESNDPNTTTYALNIDQSTTLHIDFSDTTTSQSVENNDITTLQSVEKTDTTTSQSVENTDTTTSQSVENNDTTTSQYVENNDTTTSQYVENNDTTTSQKVENNDTTTSQSAENNDTTTSQYIENNDTTTSQYVENNDSTTPQSVENNDITTSQSVENNDTTTSQSVENNDTTTSQKVENNDTTTSQSVENNDTTTSQYVENNDTTKTQSVEKNDTTTSEYVENNDTTTTQSVENNDTTTTLSVENNDTTTTQYVENNDTTTSPLQYVGNNDTLTIPATRFNDTFTTYNEIYNDTTATSYSGNNGSRHPNTTTSSATLNNHAFVMSSTEKTDTSTAFPKYTPISFLTGDTKTTVTPLGNNELSTLTYTINTDNITLNSTWDNNTEAYTTIPFPTQDNVTTTFPSPLDNNTTGVSTEANARTTTPYQSNNTVTTTPSYTSVGKTTTQLSSTKIDVSTLSSTIIYAITALSSKNNVKTITPVAQFPTGIGSTIPTSLQMSTSKSAATTAKKADLGTVMGINLKISLNMTFKDEYKNNITIKEKIARHLTNLYKDIPGFVSITIKRLLPGSIVIDFDVNTILFNSSSSSSEIGELLKNTTLQLDENGTLGDFPLTPSYIKTTTIQILQTEILNKIDSKDFLICGAGRAISLGTCVKICNLPEHICIHGTCFSHTNGTASCICEEGDSYVYSGPQCSAKTEKLKWESKYIIAAACGSGGFILVIAFACCIICRGRGTKDNLEKDYIIGRQDTLSYNHPTGLLGLNRVPSNLYFSTRDSTYNIDNRRYSVIKDKDNRSNTYIYNPSAETSQYPGNESSSGQTYYNSSFCDEEFAIKRPHLKSEMDENYKDYNRTKIYRPGYT